MSEPSFSQVSDEEDFCDVAPVIRKIFPEARLSFSPGNFYFFAKVGKEIAGFAHVVEKEGGAFILQGIGVLPQFRERGIGNRLADMAISFCEGKGAVKLMLKVKMANPAVLLYLKKGFSLKKEVGEVYVLERRRNN